MVILSTFPSGAAIFLAISGRTLTTISVTAASLNLAMASAFLLSPSASASSFKRMASASARPLASIPAASCSAAYLAASARAFELPLHAAFRRVLLLPCVDVQSNLLLQLVGERIFLPLPVCG